MVRNNFLVIVLVIVSSWLSAQIPVAQAASPEWQSDAEAAYRTSRSEQRPLLLYVTMANCVYCRKMEQTTFTDADVTKSINKHFIAASVDSEKRADLVQWFKVSTFPTTIIIAPDGKVIDYLRGYVEPEVMGQRLTLATARVASTR